MNMIEHEHQSVETSCFFINDGLPASKVSEMHLEWRKASCFSISDASHQKTSCFLINDVSPPRQISNKASFHQYHPFLCIAS